MNSRIGNFVSEPKNKLILMAGLGVLIVIVLAFLLKTYYPLLDGAKQDTDEVATFEEQVKQDLDAIKRNHDDESEKQGAILKYYDEKSQDIKSDDANKQQLLMAKARYAQSLDQGEVAVQAAKQAYDIKVTPESLWTLADICLSNGDKAQALKYYKELDEKYPEEDSQYSREPTAKSMIRMLESE